VALCEVYGDFVDGQVGEAAEVIAKVFVDLRFAWGLAFHVPAFVEGEGACHGSEDGGHDLLRWVFVFVLSRVRFLVLAVVVAPGGDGGDFILRSRVELLSGKMVESGGVKENFLNVTGLVDYAYAGFSPGPFYRYKISRGLGGARCGCLQNVGWNVLEEGGFG